MANPHFGNIGDVWKHMPLATMLAAERPGRYWESHSGAAKYVLSTSPARNYGILFFLKNVSRSQVLRSSAYNRTLEELEEMNGSVPCYPGSPLFALMLLRGRAESFIFCDTDTSCLESISDCAEWLGVNDRRITCVNADGMSALRDEIGRSSGSDLLDTFVFIDPFTPFDGLETGSSPLDLFCLAAQAGARTVMWYGFRKGEERTRCWDHLLKTLQYYGIDSSSTVLW